MDRRQQHGYPLAAFDLTLKNADQIAQRPILDHHVFAGHERWRRASRLDFGNPRPQQRDHVVIYSSRTIAEIDHILHSASPTYAP